MISYSGCLFIVFNHAKDSNNLLTIREVDNICLVVLMIVRIFFSKDNDCSIVFLHLNLANNIVILEEDGIDSFAHFQVDALALTLLRSHIMLVKSLMVVCHNRVFARVE